MNTASSWNILFCSTTLLLLVYLNEGGALLLESKDCGLVKVISHSGAVFGPNPDEFPVLEKPLFLLTGTGEQINEFPISVNRLGEASSHLWSNLEEVELGNTERHQSLLVETRRVGDWVNALRKWGLFGNGVYENPTDKEEGVDQGSGIVEEFLNFGCEPLKSPDNIKGKILVVARGSCFFYEKTLLAEAAGAVGVIVINGKREPPVRMRSPLQYDKPLKDPSIPTILISWEDFYQNIAPCYRSRTPISASIDSRGSKSPVFDSNDALNWAMLKAMFFWIIFQFTVNIFRYRRQTRNLNKRISAVQSLPQYVYHEAGPVYANSHMNRRLCIHMSHENILEGNQGICAICLESLIEDEVVRKFQCGHIFHKDCIDPWLLQSNLCPTCKRNVLGLPLANTRVTLSEPEVDVRVDD
ncbi:zinc finger (C3HC4-type RING finger) family protein [Galdieria sulphuraria]|uniref:Zinc finger (C3HC4-type RING finger) family protein n=1 Tax=Galdieria sulphuraria TaxID=130081 RepID=M2Y790_GALSU|nr:zinc finger (C3HC4-type RING finger) family protein [Galdieria sulphuraria]EME31709.1 zinc finger (C3HC4-type RING finger) family protein [Galdieria sulphuraria]|eukprot:XP_005708229.1 zinc finger (C3HC4-type RING finger) family protein [Galdieria sulphuraria]